MDPKRSARTRWIALAMAALLLAFAVLAVTARPEAVLWRRFFGLWDMTPVVLAIGCVVAAGAALAAAASRGALQRYASAVLAVGAVGIGLELAGFAGFVSWPLLLQPRGSALGTERVPHLDVSGVTQPDIAQRWGLPARAIEFRYQTDRYGFRSALDRESADLYLVGDSMLVSALLPFDQTLAARLEAALARPVMNVALIGIGAQEEAQLFRESGLDAAGRLVVQVVFEGNDLRDSRTWREREAGRAPSLPLEQRTLTFQLLRRVRRLTEPVPSGVGDRTCRIGDASYYVFWVEEAVAGLEDEAPHVTEAIDGLRRDVEAAGGRFAVVFIPSKLRTLGPSCTWVGTDKLDALDENPTPLRDALLAWSARSGVPLLDLSGPLTESTRQGRVPWFADDTHWNAEGIAVAARAMSEWEPIRTPRPAAAR